MSLRVAKLRCFSLRIRMSSAIVIKTAVFVRKTGHISVHMIAFEVRGVWARPVVTGLCLRRGVTWPNGAECLPASKMETSAEDGA